MTTRIYLVFALFLAPVWLIAQQIIYVNKNATGMNNGSNWVNAYKNLQAGLQQANAGDAVWVAQGTYYPTSDATREISFELRSGVRLLGGFIGNETDEAQRNLNVAAVLSGDIGASSDSTDNSYNVLYLFEPDSSTVVDGFVIRDGNADYSGSGSGYNRNKSGGGLYIMGADAEAFADIRNCIFLHNTARSYGGAVMLNGRGDASPSTLFYNCRFENNRSLANGGALARFGASEVDRGIEFENCTFERNKAGYRGGALFYSDSQGKDVIETKGCTFLHNQATDLGGAVFLSIGRPIAGDIYFRNSLFDGNIAYDAAAIGTEPLGYDFVRLFEIDSCSFIRHITERNLINMSYTGTDPEPSWFKVKNSNFENNTISGPFYLIIDNNDFTEISNCIISKNELKFVCAFFSIVRSEISNTIIADNKTIVMFGLPLIGSTIFNNSLFYNNIKAVSFTTGETISSIKPEIIFMSCVISQELSEKNQLANYKIKAQNSVFLDSMGTKYFHAEDTYLSHCYFDQFNCGADATVTCGPGMLIGGDPMFRDTASGDYRLDPCSPLLNGGINSALPVGTDTDLAGNARIQGGVIDIGAYETPNISWENAPVPSPACLGAYAGKLGVTPANACTPYQVSWQGPAGSMGTRTDSLLAGLYYLQITDHRGRQLLDTIEIPIANAPGLTTLTNPVQCGNPAGGSIKILVSGGNPPFAYQWSDSNNSDSLRTQLHAGEYAYTMQDAAGCVKTVTAEVGVQGQLILSGSAMPSDCYGSEDGTLHATASGGIAPFNYVWQNGITGSTLSNIGAGFYDVTATDVFGCTGSMMLELDQPDSLSVAAIIQHATAQNAQDGAISIAQISGGTAPYIFEWSDGTTANNLTNLAPGEYSLTVRDTKGCQKRFSFIVSFVNKSTEAFGIENALLLYPNPANTETNIALQSVFQAERLEIYDALGNLIQSERFQQGSPIHIQRLASGVYLVLLRNTQGQVLAQGNLAVMR
jgi:hypothetical protein